MGSGSFLAVVTHARWVAEELATGAVTRSSVETGLFDGLDLPVRGEGDSRVWGWWCPTGWAARAVRAMAELGVPGPTGLVSAGPYWLSGVDQDLTGRAVVAATVSDLAAGLVDVPERGFCKPAEVKSDRVPAGWRSVAGFVRDAGEYLDPETVVEVSDTWLDLAAEYRVFVLGGEPVAVSPYLMGGVLWHEGMAGPEAGSAVGFVREALEQVGAGSGFPDAFVMDVGVTGAGRWVVVESNPVWSSAFYGADMGPVVDTVLAGSCGDAGGRWGWTPDPWLVRVAGRQRLLGARSCLMG